MNQPILRTQTLKSNAQVVHLRGRVKKDFGNELLIEFSGGRFMILPSNKVTISKHNNPKKRDYITVSAPLAEARGLVMREEPKPVIWQNPDPSPALITSEGVAIA